MEDQMDRVGPPIFIVGVPRSGTTLLRALLGQHSQIAAGAESPWLCGSYGGIASLKGLVENWSTHTLGPIASGRSPESLRRGAAALIDHLLGEGGKRWVEKTPNHLAEIQFLFHLFPDARFVHVVRDGRDVACSTRALKGGGMWGDFLEHEGERLPNSRLMALVRWVRWNQRFESWAESLKLHHLRVRYEDLVCHPHTTLRGLCDALSLPWEESLLSYPGSTLSAPGWEAGAQDVKRWDRLAQSEIGKWKKEMNGWEQWVCPLWAGSALSRYGYDGDRAHLAPRSCPEYA